MLTGSRAVGIEVADRRLIGVEADPATDPPTIRQAISGDVPATGFGESLRNLLAESGIVARVTHLVLSDTDSVHRVQLLPSMTAGERQLFLERELRREMGGNPLFGHVILRQAEGAPRKDEVLVAAVPRKDLDQTLVSLLTAGLRPPRLVTTAPLALARAAETLSPDSFDRPTAVAHWGFRGLTIIIAAEGTLKFVREIPHLTAPGLDVAEWFVTEVQRSIRQYVQTVKGGAIERVLVGAAEARFERVLPDLEARLGLPLVNLNEAIQTLLPEGTEETSALPAGAFLLPLGAALLSPKETANLLPPSILAKERTTVLKKMAGAAAALLVVSLGYYAWGAAQEAANYKKALVRVTADRQSRLAESAQVDGIKQQRETQYQRIRLLKSDPLGGPPLAVVFKELSRVAPGDLRLERLVFGRDEGGARIRLTGAVESGDLAQAQSEFNRFYFGLQGSPLFSEVIFNPPAASRVTIQQAPTVVVEGRTARDFQQQQAGSEQEREAVKGRGKKLAFELELRLKEIK